MKFAAIFFAATILWSGCDGGSNSSQTAVVRSGVFVDSPVKGLEYRTDTLTGLTETDGTFRYLEGETVAFYIGNIFLGEASAKEVMTPIDLVAGAVDETEPTVTNICRLLQSLDLDGNPDNGISISQQTRQEVEDRPIDLTLSVTDFENDTDVQNLFVALNALGIFSIEGDRTLIPAEHARSHLRVTLSKMGDGNDPVEISKSPDEDLPLQKRIINQRQWAYAESSEINDLVDGLNSLAFDMHHQFQGAGINRCFSPYVLSRAMAMTLTGANGDTADQIRESLKLSIDYARLHAVFNALDLKLDPQRFKGENHIGPPILDTEAAAWGQSGYFVPIDFYNVLAASYGAAIVALDFQTQDLIADGRIEAWVAQQTGDTPSNAVSSVTDRVRFSLANTVVLNAEWAHPFDANSTIDGDFELISGSTVSVPMMNRTGRYLYVFDEGYEAIEIPFSNSALAMLVVLPESGNFSEFEEALDFSVFQEILESLEPKSIMLSLPNFTSSLETDLVDAFSRFGITMATVEGDADFSRINGVDSLYINGGSIKASISVEETAAQGASSAVLTMEGKEDLPEFIGDFLVVWLDPLGNHFYSGLAVEAINPLQIKEIALGRPFIYLIYDRSSGIILFIGRILDPSI